MPGSTLSVEPDQGRELGPIQDDPAVSYFPYAIPPRRHVADKTDLGSHRAIVANDRLHPEAREKALADSARAHMELRGRLLKAHKMVIESTLVAEFCVTWCFNLIFLSTTFTVKV